MQSNPTHPKRQTILFAWITTLLISTLPNILWQEFIGSPGIWLLWSKIILLALLIALSFLWAPARELRVYFLLVLLLFALEEIASRLGATALWTRWFPASAAFVPAMFGIQLRRVAVTLLMVLALLLIYKRPARFFLRKGHLDAPTSKLAFLIDEGTPWNKLGWILTACITLGTLAFLILAGRPTGAQLRTALPLLPAVLVLAAMNAFAEELNYRAALLAPLFPAVGKTHSVLLTAAFFGLGHFYGVPYGVVGVVMSFVLGYFLSKAMVETKGFFWPWFIHFWQDVAIFSFMAIGAIIAGG
ncbi:CPBP family intramembrane metalloprotease [bacterium]|nr:CPBP family intramembrane metalloprotease [bacterium]